MPERETDVNEIGTEAIIQAAREQAGVQEFDNESFRPGLELLSRNAIENPAFTDNGRAILKALWTRGLANRLKVDQYHRDHPALAQAPVDRPLFVLGMPRTGTTVMSRLLETDPDRRTLLGWEMSNSVPPPEKGALKTDPRCLAAAAADQARIKADPTVLQRHFEPADGPGECVFIHAQDFKTLALESMGPNPAYAQWLLSDEVDIETAYRHQKRVLQVLQEKTGGIWSLKMPSHALYLDALVKIFPDARLVWMHRDPYKAMGSLLSLIYHAQRKFVSEVSRDWLRENYVPQMFAHIRRAWDFDKANPGRIYHLHYDRMMTDPIGEMRRLYAGLGDEFTPAVEAGMRRWLDQNPAGKHGSHRYGLEEYGLTVDDLHEGFADYVEHYGVASELNGAVVA